MSESYKQRIIEYATFYKKDEASLKAFERKVNEASIELCLKQPSMLSENRCLLLSMARKKASDGYSFKKGHSRSKAYGKHSSGEESAKRPKLSQQIKRDRLLAIEEEVKDTARVLSFKEKRISQAESDKKYKMCEQLAEEVIELKSKQRGLHAEKRMLEQKMNRAKRYRSRKDSDLSGYSSTMSCDSRDRSPSDSPMPRSSRSMSPEPIHHEPTITLLSPKETRSPTVPRILSPTENGSRMNPVDCESPDAFVVPATPETKSSEVCVSAKDDNYFLS